jgi:serine/threonine protein kinase
MYFMYNHHDDDIGKNTFLNPESGDTWKFTSFPYRLKNNVVSILFQKEISALEALKGPSFIPEVLLYGKSLSNYHVLLKRCGGARQLKDWCWPSDPSKCVISSQIFAGLTECYHSILNNEIPAGSFSMDCYLSIFKQLIDAISYIHSRGFFHGHIRTKKYFGLSE